MVDRVVAHQLGLSHSEVIDRKDKEEEEDREKQESLRGSCLEWKVSAGTYTRSGAEVEGQRRGRISQTYHNTVIPREDGQFV